jgi:hypothetical protein
MSSVLIVRFIHLEFYSVLMVNFVRLYELEYKHDHSNCILDR